MDLRIPSDKEIINTLRGLENFESLIFAYVFGSRAEGNPGKGSDLDLCCHYELGQRKLRDQDIALASATPDIVDTSVFSLLPMQIRVEVFKGRLIYVSDKAKAYDMAERTLREYRFFRPLYLEVIG